MITITTNSCGQWWILWHEFQSSNVHVLKPGHMDTDTCCFFLKKKKKTKVEIETAKAFCDVNSPWPSTLEILYQFLLLIKNDSIGKLKIP